MTKTPKTIAANLGRDRTVFSEWTPEQLRVALASGKMNLARLKDAAIRQKARIAEIEALIARVES